MDKGQMLDYIIAFSIENNWEYENVPDQLRSFFTTWCFMFHVDADTKECDDALHTLYWRAELEEIIEYDDFEVFMIKFII